MQSELLRPRELESIVGLKQARIYQLLKAGVIPSTRVGGSIRIPRRALETWLDAQAGNALAGSTPQREPVGA